MEGELRAEAAALQEVCSALDTLQETLTGSLQDLEVMAENMERFAALNQAWSVVFEGDPPLDEAAASSQ